jgi:predicted nuclease with TOPRIM domain
MNQRELLERAAEILTFDPDEIDADHGCNECSACRIRAQVSQLVKTNPAKLESILVQVEAGYKELREEISRLADAQARLSEEDNQLHDKYRALDESTVKLFETEEPQFLN